MKTLASQIYAAVRAGELSEPFTVPMVREAVPGWAKHTYSVFLPKHRIGNPGGMTELFERTQRAHYRTITREVRL